MAGGIPHIGKIETLSGRRFLIKTGINSRIYRCEANGLSELAKADAIDVVKVFMAGDDFILTEFIEDGVPDTSFFSEFGRKFARLHRYQSDSFGFYEDNFIGATPQLNIPRRDERNNWLLFYWNKRLFYQYNLAEQNGYTTIELRKMFRKLESQLESILEGSNEPPCLLHGDLWSGNRLCNHEGRVVLIDPAVYYGHREADLAMTKLFGGYPQSFYTAYREEYPLKEGWRKREGLYMLYHVLNHLNLFGPGYLAQTFSILHGYTSGSNL